LPFAEGVTLSGVIDRDWVMDGLLERPSHFQWQWYSLVSMFLRTKYYNTNFEYWIGAEGARLNVLFSSNSQAKGQKIRID